LERAFSRGLRPWISGELLARALTATGRPGEAAQTLALIDPAAGGDVKALAALGALALQVKRADLAERFLRECLRRAPDDSAGHQRLGLALASLGRVAEAAAELEAAVRLDPADPVAQLNLAVVYAQQGRVAEARARAEEALRLRPDYDHARRLLAALGR
jgi:Flp pilus assembly protein TadD